MLQLVEKKSSLVSIRRCPLTAGQRVSRRYRRAQIRRAEYKKLKAIVPSVSARQKVSKVTVIEEAIKYIDELHRALYNRMPLMTGRNSITPFLNMSPQSIVSHMLRATPSLTTPESTSLTVPAGSQGPHLAPLAGPKGVQPIRTQQDLRYNTGAVKSSSRIVSKQLSVAPVTSSCFRNNLTSIPMSDNSHSINQSLPLSSQSQQLRVQISAPTSATISSAFITDCNVALTRNC